MRLKRTSWIEERANSRNAVHETVENRAREREPATEVEHSEGLVWWCWDFQEERKWRCQELWRQTTLFERWALVYYFSLVSFISGSFLAVTTRYACMYRLHNRGCMGCMRLVE